MLLRIGSDTTNPQEILDACQGIAALSPEDHSRTELDDGFTKFDGSKCVPLLGMVAGIFAGVKLEHIEILSGGERIKLVSQINRADEVFMAIGKLRPEHLIGHHSVEEFIENSIRRPCSEIRRGMSEIMAYVGSEPPELYEAGRVMAQMMGWKKEAEVMVREVGDAVLKVKELTKQAGVATQANVFENASGRHAKAKKVWLGWSIALAVVTAASGYLLVMPEQVAAAPAQAIQVIATRLIVFGVFSYALVGAVRTYRAEAHNEIVNQHRHDALRVFEVFASSPSDEATKDAILLEATRCVFSHRPSGFGQKDDGAQSSHHMLELTRNVAGGGEG